MTKLLSLIFLCLLIFTPQLLALDTDGLVGAWLMDDRDGEDVTDSSDNGLDGKIVRGAPKWVDGKFGGALEFGGSDMVTVDDNDALDLQSYTLSAWVKIPKITGVWQIIASKEKRNPTGRNYGIFSNINSGVIHYSFTTNNNWNSFNAKTDVADGNWHHIAVTYEKPNFKLYLNGTVDDQTAPDTDPDKHDNFLYIGGCDIGNYWMTGIIDEVVLFDRALSDAEINNLKDDGIESGLDVQPGSKLVTTWSNIKSSAIQ